VRDNFIYEKPGKPERSAKVGGKTDIFVRFLPRMTEKIRPIIKILKKTDSFKWDDRWEDAFNEIKAVVSSTPILKKPRAGSRLLLYLSISEDAVS